MNSTIVSSGNTYRLYDSAVKTHEVLPVGTYQIDFSPLSGYSLNRIDDLKVGDEHVYGDHPRLVKRVLRTYQTGSRSLGLLMSGEKGMGKSLMLRMTAEETQREVPSAAALRPSRLVASFQVTKGRCSRRATR